MRSRQGSITHRLITASSFDHGTVTSIVSITTLLVSPCRAVVSLRCSSQYSTRSCSTTEPPHFAKTHRRSQGWRRQCADDPHRARAQSFLRHRRHATSQFNRVIEPQNRRLPQRIAIDIASASDNVERIGGTTLIVARRVGSQRGRCDDAKRPL